jgi:hypothetical protein
MLEYEGAAMLAILANSIYIIVAVLFQVVLIVHFALRKWHFATAIRYGRPVYALSIPAAGICVILLLGGISWSFWLGGFIYLAWAMYGYINEYIRGVQWRTPIHWPIFGPYIGFYLATVMLYWWPLALIYKPLWYAYGILFLTSTYLNVTSHHPKGHEKQYQEYA